MSIYTADLSDPFVKGLQNFEVELPDDAKKYFTTPSGELNPFYGLTHTDESKRQISETKKRQYATGEVVHPLLGKGHSEESKRKMSEYMSSDKNHFLGKKQSQETISKRIAKTTGRKNTDEAKSRMALAAKNRKTIDCPHCGKAGQPSNMKRWHFDNCKHS